MALTSVYQTSLLYLRQLTHSSTGTLQTEYYNVRTRAFCAFVIPWADIIGGFMVGYFLDNQKLTVKQRARWSFIGLMVMNLALWCVLQSDLQHNRHCN